MKMNIIAGEKKMGENKFQGIKKNIKEKKFSIKGKNETELKSIGSKEILRNYNLP